MTISSLTAPDPLAALKNRKPHHTKFIADSYTIDQKLQKEFQYALDQQKKSASLLPSSFTFASSQTNAPIQTETFSVGPFTAHAACAQGRREEMEDAHIAQFLPDTQIPLFGVFDGHGGSEASQFLKQNLPAYLSHYLEKFGRSDTGIWNALKHAFIELDHDYTGPAGSAAVIALIIDNQIWTANLGDSRALLSTPKTTIQLSEDAKPNHPRYLHSIQKRGGSVFNNYIASRVGDHIGLIGLARTFGDHAHISPSSHLCAIPHAPKITKHPLLPSSTLLLACDGLWDVATTAQVSNSIQRNATAAHLVAKAYNAGSQDNITALLITQNKDPK